MSLRNFLLSALASSQIAFGSDSPLHEKRESTAHNVHGIMGHSWEKSIHPHSEVSSGFQHNHILDQGQFMEGNFSFLGLHGSIDNWSAYYHWLQDDEMFEHRAGILYSSPLSKGVNLTTWLSGTYEFSWSTHQGSHDWGIDKHHKKSTDHAVVHQTPDSDTDPIFYFGFSARVEAILQENNRSITSVNGWAEYDFGNQETLFIHGWIQHVRNLGLGIEFITRARIVHILETDSSHLREWSVWIFGVGINMPIWEPDTWSLKVEWQITTRNDKTALIGLSRAF